MKIQSRLVCDNTIADAKRENSFCLTIIIDILNSDVLLWCKGLIHFRLYRNFQYYFYTMRYSFQLLELLLQNYGSLSIHGSRLATSRCKP